MFTAKKIIFTKISPGYFSNHWAEFQLKVLFRSQYIQKLFLFKGLTPCDTIKFNKFDHFLQQLHTGKEDMAESHTKNINFLRKNRGF